MSSYRVIRGYNSARNWNYNTSSNVNPNYGWRPALYYLLAVSLRIYSPGLYYEIVKGSYILRRMA